MYVCQTNNTWMTRTGRKTLEETIRETDDEIRGGLPPLGGDVKLAKSKTFRLTNLINTRSVEQIVIHGVEAGIRFTLSADSKCEFDETVNRI